VSLGHNVPQIVDLSGRSEAVIRTHKKNVMKKLGIKNVEALVAWGIAHGYNNR
jgi:DNA-binding CsgD family transcriptional regulator